jgi:hypothetical protein
MVHDMRDDENFGLRRARKTRPKVPVVLSEPNQNFACIAGGWPLLAWNPEALEDSFHKITNCPTGQKLRTVRTAASSARPTVNPRLGIRRLATACSAVAEVVGGPACRESPTRGRGILKVVYFGLWCTGKRHGVVMWRRLGWPAFLGALRSLSVPGPFKASCLVRTL